MEDKVAERFIKSINSSRPTTAAFLSKLEKNPDFKTLYENLKSKNIGELDPVINLLGRIATDDALKDFLRMHRALGMRGKETVIKSNGHIPQDTADGSVNSRQYSHQHSFPTTSSTTDIPTSKSSQQTEDQRQHDTQRSKFSQMSIGVKSKDEVKVKRRNRKFDKRDWAFLSFDYKPVDWSSEDNVKPLASMPVYSKEPHKTQEAVLTRDLLRVLVGIEGKYIRLHPHQENKNKNVLVVDEGADQLLKTLASKIISICPMYSSVVHFIDENDRGLVNQSLAAAMKGVIKDFFTLMAQLESQYKKNNLTMQKVWYYLQPFFVNFDILKSFSSSINNNNLYGGAVLSILHNKTVSLTGNVKSLDFCLQITRDACVPYFDILEKWLTEGVIYDRFNEFMIEDVYASTKGKELSACDNDYFWENRYRINANKTPNFLLVLQDKILNTGKFLSVIRECGKSLEKVSCFQDPLIYAVEEKVYVDRIEASYQSASRQLLHLLLEECNLIGHLLSVKHFFFMDQGDVMVHFMDSAEDELSKDIDDTNPMRLSSLLELAMRTSVMKNDPNHELVQIQLLEESLLAQLSTIISIGNDRQPDVYHDSRCMKGFEAMTLTYEVKWPLTLILSQKSITCYQMLFRQLFMCKYVERQLHCVWKDNKVAKLYALKAVTGYAEAFALRQKMLNFVQNLVYFMTVEVIEPNFQSFLEKINSYTQLDQMSKEHTNFVEGCLRDCMMTQEFALQYMVKLLNLCLTFSEFMQVCFFLSFLVQMFCQ